MGDGTGGGDLDAALDGQVAYYRRRAPVYDQWWLREGDYALSPEQDREWHEDVAEVERFVADAPISGHVLELAAAPDSSPGCWRPGRSASPPSTAHRRRSR